MDELFTVLIGLWLIIVGIKLFSNPKIYSSVYQYTWDTNGYNIPVGLVLIGFGLYLIWSTYKKWRGNR